MAETIVHITIGEFHIFCWVFLIQGWPFANFENIQHLYVFKSQSHSQLHKSQLPGSALTDVRFAGTKKGRYPGSLIP